jgi:hypothetical protein
MLDALMAIRTHREIEVSAEEVAFLIGMGLVLIMSGSDFRSRENEVNGLVAAYEAAEKAKKEASRLYDEWRVLERLNSYWHRCWAGEEQLVREEVNREARRNEYKEKELEAGKLVREHGRLAALASTLLRYAPINGDWARLTPAGEFARTHLKSGISGNQELSRVHYKNHVQTLFLKAVSELTGKYSY